MCLLGGITRQSGLGPSHGDTSPATREQWCDPLSFEASGDSIRRTPSGGTTTFSCGWIDCTHPCSCRSRSLDSHRVGPHPKAGSTGFASSTAHGASNSNPPAGGQWLSTSTPCGSGARRSSTARYGRPADRCTGLFVASRIDACGIDSSRSRPNRA